MSDDALKTPLHDAHVAAGAAMIVRDGWWVPEHYGDPAAEASAVRTRGGVFDSTPLGRIRVSGDGALTLLETVCSADVARQEDDTALLTEVRDADGAKLDTAFILRLEGFWVLTTNPGAREGVLASLSAQGEPLGAKVDDQTFKTAMITVAGPEVAELLDPLLPEKVSPLPRGEARMGSMMIARYIAMRTGSTGQWSVEAAVPNTLVTQAWRFITEKADPPLPPIGVAARDILRKEAGLA